MNREQQSPVKFWIDCVPPKATSQQKGAMVLPGNNIRFFKKKAVEQAERSFMAMLYPHKPTTPLNGPLSAKFTFVWPWRKSEPKKVTEREILKPMDKRPDCSNIIKMLEDSMTTLRFWDDDSQIADLSIAKFWGQKTGIGINVQPHSSCHLRSAEIDVFGIPNVRHVSQVIENLELGL